MPGTIPDSTVTLGDRLEFDSEGSHHIYTVPNRKLGDYPIEDGVPWSNVSINNKTTFDVSTSTISRFYDCFCGDPYTEAVIGIFDFGPLCGIAEGTTMYMSIFKLRNQGTPEEYYQETFRSEGSFRAELWWFVVGTWINIIDGIELCGDGHYKMQMWVADDPSKYIYKEFDLTGAPTPVVLTIDLDISDLYILVNEPIKLTNTSLHWCVSGLQSYDNEHGYVDIYKHSNCSAPYPDTVSYSFDKYYYEAKFWFYVTSSDLLGNKVGYNLCEKDKTYYVHMFKNTISIDKPTVDRNETFTITYNESEAHRLYSIKFSIKNKNGEVVRTITTSHPEAYESQSFSLDYAGIYDVELELVHANIGTQNLYSQILNFKEKITVLQPPPPPPPPTTPVNADFSYSVSSGTSPLTVNFNNLSENATSYKWEFQRDWTGHVFLTSYLENPSVTFTDVGYYNVTLHAYSDDGVDYKTITQAIRVLNDPLTAPIASFNILEYSTSTPSTVSFDNTSTGIINTGGITWDFGDGSPISHSYNTSHTYEYPGSYTVTLTVSNDAGSTQYSDVVSFSDMTFNNDFSKTVIGDIFVPSSVQFIDYTAFEHSCSVFLGHNSGMIISDADDLLRVGLMFNFVGTEIPSGFYNDGYDDVPITADTNFLITFIDGNNVSYGVIDAHNNISYPNIEDGGTGVSIESAHLNDKIRNADYLWDFGDGEYSSLKNPIHKYKTTGSFDVMKTLIIDGVHYNKLKENFIITKSSNASIILNVSDGVGNAPHLVNFSVDVTLPYDNNDEVTYGWSFGDGYFQNTSTPNISHTYSSHGKYTANVTAFYGNRVVVATNRNSIIID